MTDPTLPTALVILAVLAAALVAWIVVAWKATPYTWWQFGLHLVNQFFACILWRGSVTGSIDLPRDRGAVIVSNHISGIDPLLIQLSVLRIVHWMVAREYFYMPLLSFIFKHMQSIPVNRAGVDTAATKMAIRYAQEGELVGLFPEGRVNLTDELLLPGRPGAALIALRAGVPVIPCYVQNAPYDGTALGSFFMAARAHIIVGKPIDLSPYLGRDNDRSVLQDLTLLFLKEIAKLAGHPEFEPQLAGRHWKPSDVEVDTESNGRRASSVSPASQTANHGG
jgi:1-acyl-sn-glycerol-3-phosphate acyltransferase